MEVQWVLRDPTHPFNLGLVLENTPRKPTGCRIKTRPTRVMGVLQGFSLRSEVLNLFVQDC